MWGLAVGECGVDEKLSASGKKASMIARFIMKVRSLHGDGDG